MTPDLQNEFRLLSEQAMQQLRNVAASGSYRNVFSFWAMPSFAPWLRCTIYQPAPRKKDRLPFAEFSIWRSDFDREKLRSPIERLKYPKEIVPTFETDILQLVNSDVEQIEQRIRGIFVPLNIRDTITGVDGTNFEFHSEELFDGATIRWWHYGPVEWRPFTETIIQFVDELDGRRKAKRQSNSKIHI